MPQNSREHNIVHISGHWIFDQQIVRNLVNSHEHECQLASRSILRFFGELVFCTGPLPLNSQILHRFFVINLLIFGTIHRHLFFSKRRCIFHCHFFDSLECIELIIQTFLSFVRVERLNHFLLFFNLTLPFCDLFN